MATITARQIAVPTGSFTLGCLLLVLSNHLQWQQGIRPAAVRSPRPVVAVPAPLNGGTPAPGGNDRSASPSTPRILRYSDLASLPQPRRGDVIPVTPDTAIIGTLGVPIGKEDPFRPAIRIPHAPAPVLVPSWELAGLPEPAAELTLPAPPLPAPPASARPAPTPAAAPAFNPTAFKAGIALQGILSDDEPAVILSISGEIRLLRVGDIFRSPRGEAVVVGSIDTAALNVTLADTRGHSVVLRTE